MDAAGVVLAVPASVATTLLAALKTGASVTLGLVFGAIFTTAAGASGLYSWGRKLTAAAKVTAQGKAAPI